MARDNFNTKTIEVLAKRVGYLCSNPNCGKHTVGPNSDPEKATLIGIAAHITAASSGGPRYDSALSEAQRSHIDNGIWLCANCSVLIDKDPTSYPIKLIREWKTIAEEKMQKNITGEIKNEVENKVVPVIEADLIWTGNARLNRGFSYKNKQVYKEPILVGTPLYAFWDLIWDFNFVLYNNSSVPAYNIKIDSVGNKKFTRIPELNKINNLPPYQNIDFETRFERKNIEATHLEADEILKKKIPNELNGLELKVTYFDDKREEHISVIKILNEEIINEKIK